MVGIGFTVMVQVIGVPAHPAKVGVTELVAVIAADVVLVAVNVGVLPVPLAAKPIAVFEFVHANVAPEGILVNALAGTYAPLHTVLFAGTVTVGKGFTVTVATAVPVQVPVVAVTVYDVVAVGETVNGFAVEPVFHEQVVPPLAVKVAACPLQMVGEFTVTVIAPATVTVETAVPTQPEVVPVTV